MLSLIYPPLCVHCQLLMDDRSPPLCNSCLAAIDLEQLEGRCLTCFAALEGRRCSICSQRKTLVKRQIAAADPMGASETLFRLAKSGDHSVLAQIAALMSYQWTRHEMPIPDVVMPLPGLDVDAVLSAKIAKTLGVISQSLLKKRWDYQRFLTEGVLSSCFQAKRGVSLADQSVLIVSLALDDAKNYQVAQELQRCFPSAIYALSFISSLS